MFLYQKIHIRLLESLSKVLLPDAKLSVAKTIESLANEKAKKLNGKIKKGRITLHICPTCKGNGYLELQPMVNTERTIHQCWDCDSEGEFYETVDDNLIDDGILAKAALNLNLMDSIQQLQRFVGL